MREQARIFLAIFRDASNQGIFVPLELGPILTKHLGITEQEMMEVGEILKADMLEWSATRPDFERIKAELAKFPRL